MLLDGGPSRAFSDSDIALMEDDLTTLKVWVAANISNSTNYKNYLQNAGNSSCLCHTCLPTYSLHVVNVYKHMWLSNGVVLLNFLGILRS